MSDDKELNSPGYNIPDEINTNQCLRGSLVMTKQWDPENGSYVPDTASFANAE